MTPFNTPIMLEELLPPLVNKIWRKISVGKARLHPFGAIPADIRPGIILDVGANEGKVAEAALRTHPQGRAFCFELVPGTFQAWRQRLARYGDRVVCFNEALPDVNAQTEFNLTNFNGAKPLQPQPDSHMTLNPHVREIGKEVITASCPDDVAVKLPSQKIDGMKIDVEGHALKVLQGGREFIRRNVDPVTIEISPIRDTSWLQHAVFDIFSLLKEWRFALLNVFDFHHASESHLIVVRMDCMFRQPTTLRAIP